MKQKFFIIIALSFINLVFQKPVISQNNKELIITKKKVMVYENLNSEIGRAHV